MRTDRKTITAGLAAAGLLGLGLYVAVPAFAADSSPSPTASPSPTSSAEPTERGAWGDRGDRGEGRPFGWGRPGPRFGPGEFGGPRAGGVHGEATIRDRDGGFRVVTFQRGEITAVSSTTLTVKSVDGTSWTWTANDGTKVRKNREDAALKDLGEGDEIRVAGERSGETRTARLVRALD